MNSLLAQLKNRRIKLGLKQHDMLLRAGISRQQYQRLESKGNPRLDTLELIASGLNGEILLVPREKLQAVKAVLEGDTVDIPPAETSGTGQKVPVTLPALTGAVGDVAVEAGNSVTKRLSDDPWKDLLGDDE